MSPIIACGDAEIDEQQLDQEYRVLCSESNTPEWLTLRKTGIGASEAAVVLGVSKWATRHELWRDKRSDTVVDIGNDRMEFGHLAEDVIVRFIQNHPERFAFIGTVHPAEGLLQSVQWPWLLGTLDRRVLTPDGIYVPLELKSVNDHVAREWLVMDDVDEADPFGTGPGRGARLVVPDKYQVQVQQQMAVTGAPYAFVCVWLGKERIDLIRVDRDDEFIRDKLVGEVGRFWRDHVQTGIAPAPNARDDLWAIWPGNRGEVVTADDDVLETAWMFRKASVDARDTKASLEEYKTTLALFMGDATELLHPVTGNVIHTLRGQSNARTIDWALLEKDYPDAYAACVKDGTWSRRHRPTKEPIDLD
jgi:hypothetical protein